MEVVDVDGDNYNDVITLSGDGKRFRIHTYNHNKYRFDSKYVYRLDSGNSECNITSIKALAGNPIMLAFTCEGEGLIYTDLPGYKRTPTDEATDSHEFSLKDILPDWTAWFNWA